MADYLSSPLNQRRELRRRIIAQRRAGLAAALVAAPLPDRHRAGLLVACAPQVVAAQLPELAEAVPNLAALARRHPDLVTAELRRRILGQSVAQRNRGWDWVGPALRELCRARPIEVAQLLATAAPSHGLPDGARRQAAGLLQASPEAMTRVLAESQAFAEQLPSCGVKRQFRKLAWPLQLRLLAAHRDHDLSVASLLGALPPSLRERAFLATYQEVATHSRSWEPELLAVLTREARYREVTRMLGLPNPDPQPELLASFAHPAEAKQLVRELSQHPDPSRRGAAWQAILLAALRSADAAWIDAGFTEFTAHSQAAPTLAVALSGLAQLPATALLAVPAPHWRRLAQALDRAQDATPECFGRLAQALWRALCANPNSVEAPQLAAVLAGLPGQGPAQWLPEPQRAVAATLLGLFEARLPDALVLPLAGALRRSLSQYPGLRQRLEELAAGAIAGRPQYLEVLLSEPAFRAERLGELLERDPSLIAEPVVRQACCRYRPDLSRLLYEPLPRDPGWPGNPEAPVLAEGPFKGWAPETASPYSLALARFAAHPLGERWLRLRALRVLASLPHLDEQVPSLLLGVESPGIRQAGIDALARSRAVEWSLPELLRLATAPYGYAALRAGAAALGQLPPAQAWELLGLVAEDNAAPLGIRKLAVAQLARLRHPGTAELLTQFVSGNEFPEQLRAAAAVALTQFPGPSTWRVLGEAVAAPAVVSAVARLRPEQFAASHREQLAATLGTAPLTQELAGPLIPWLPYAPQLINRLADLARSDPSDAVLIALASAASWEPGLQLAAELCQQATSPAQPSAEIGMDLPQLRLLERLVDTLTSLDEPALAERRGELEQLAQLLGRFPETEVLGWQARLAAVDWGDPAQQLSTLAGLVPDAMRAHELLVLAQQRLALVPSHRLDPQLAKAAAALLGDDQAVAATLGLALVRHVGHQLGWPGRWRALLRLARHHPIPAVASWARQVDTLSGFDW